MDACERACVRPSLERPGPVRYGDLFRFHIQFMVTLPAYRTLDYDSYLGLVLRRSSRVFYGGMLKQWPNTEHPINQQRGVIAYGAYQTEQPCEAFTVDELAFLHERITSCVPYAEGHLVFVPDGATQTAQLRSQRDALRERGVPVLMPEELH